MHLSEAKTNIMNYYSIGNPTESDRILYVESMETMLDITLDPELMMEIAWYYCEMKRFDLEKKYLEMAAEYGYLPAYEELGYMYYYGQDGVQDYQKAYECFSKVAEADAGSSSLWCSFKLADMYRFGCYVDRDEQKYRDMIEAAYDEVYPPTELNAPFPEIALRLAGIRADDGDADEAIRLLREAKAHMAERLSIDPFWRHIEVMDRIVSFLYDLTPIDEADMDFYDLFYVTRATSPETTTTHADNARATTQQPTNRADNPRPTANYGTTPNTPTSIRFKRNGTEHRIDIADGDDGDHALHFGRKWYRDFEELCNKATIKGERVTAIYDEFHDFERD